MFLPQFLVSDLCSIFNEYIEWLAKCEHFMIDKVNFSPCLKPFLLFCSSLSSRNFQLQLRKTKNINVLGKTDLNLASATSTCLISLFPIF